MAKDYLKCRMDNNLMAPDEFKNLGFPEEARAESSQGKPIANAAGSGHKKIP